MKYSININQKSVVDLGLDLDLTDLAIFDFMSDFALTDACEKVYIQTENAFAYWFSADLILSQLPILRITPRAVRQHINNLEKCGLLTLCKGELDARRTHKAYYLFGPMYARLKFFDLEQPNKECKGGLPPVSEKNCRELGKELPRARKNISDNNIYIDKGIEDNDDDNKQKQVFAESPSSSGVPVQGELDLFDAPQPDASVEAETKKERKGSGQKKESRETDISSSVTAYGRQLRNVHDLAKELLESHTWMESLERKGWSRDYICSRMEAFVCHLETTFDVAKTKPDFTKHFFAWVNKVETSSRKESRSAYERSNCSFEESLDIIRQTCNNFHNN